MGKRSPHEATCPRIASGLHQGRSMSTIYSVFSRSPRHPIGTLRCPVAIARVVTISLMLIVGVGSAIASSAQSLTIDLSHQPIGAPPQNFEFWRAGEADPGHWKVVREASSDGGASIQRSGAA